MTEQVFYMIALNKGVLDGLSVTHLKRFKQEFFSFAQRIDPGVVTELQETKSLSEDQRNRILACLKKYFEVTL